MIILLSLATLTFVGACGGTGEVAEPAEPTAQELEDTTEHDHEADFSAFIGADYEPGADDTVLEYDFEELIAQSDGLFAFPDLDWNSDFSALAEHFGVLEMPEYPEVDPELWLSISCGGEQILAVPYFSVNEQSSIKQCQIMVEENYFDTAQMQETFDLLLESAQTQLGQPVEDSLEGGSENMYFWRWQSQLEDGGLNRLELYTEVDAGSGDITGFGMYLASTV